MSMTQIITLSIAVLALLVAGTYLLPRQVQVQRQATVPLSPSAILALAGSNSGYQRFNPYRTSDPQLKVSLFGPDSGVGSGFHFESKDGKGSQTVASVSDTAVDFKIDLGPMGQPTQRIETRPGPTGTTVVWTMQADMGMNPIGRVMGMFLDKMVGPQFETGLKNMSQITQP